jgi:hypothetical protein
MSDLMEEKCPNCGWFEEFPEDDEQSWEYTTTSYENRMEAIKKSAIRMRNELGYGIPEIVYHDTEGLGSCISGIWRQDENKKC